MGLLKNEECRKKKIQYNIIQFKYNNKYKYN